MAVACAIVGLDLIQKDWIEALRNAGGTDWFKIVAVGKRNLSEAREVGQMFDVPFYADLRRMLLETAPQMVLLDRPADMALEFIEACVQQNIAIFSLGPPVKTLEEARRLSILVEPRTHLLYSWPRFSCSWGFGQARQTENFFRGVQFVGGQWSAANHAVARVRGVTEGAVRSLSVLAWDAFRSIIEIVGLPAALYAAIDGTNGQQDSFIDVTGNVGVVMRTLDGATIVLQISDQETSLQREISIANREGRLKLSDLNYRWASARDNIIDADSTPPLSGALQALRELENFCHHFTAPASPHRGWPHLLPETAAMMTTMIVSHRTGMAESPQHFHHLNR
ncbi:MAG: Gfo/Idh/MocA family oxidoreductase [Planctomycetia bacterium]|nr:Gfo/Idh/MocA family oxidoreductase [Planctomycetia bacterium]